ncbi:MAG: hypothetical protein AB1631_15745 [Acidobacteriota bacterium]
MARPRSIFERNSSPVIPPPDSFERRHEVIEDDTLMGIANLSYALEEYDPSLWRLVAETNEITNPFTFSDELRGQVLRIPPRPLPQFID